MNNNAIYPSVINVFYALSMKYTYEYIYVKILFGTIQSGIFNKVPSTVLDSDNHFRPTELIKFDAKKNDVL